MKSKQFFYLLLASLFIALISVFGAFVWGDGLLEKKSLDISALIAKRDVSREKILQLQKAQRDVENLDEITTLLDRLLPQKKEQEKLIADVIFTASSEAGIPFSKVPSFSFSGSGEPSDLSGTVKSDNNPGVFEYPFTLQISDITYETLLNLLKEIETNGRIVQVENIQIAPLGDGTSSVSVTIAAKAYIKP